MASHQLLGGWPVSKKTVFLLLSLGSGIGCGLGQHLFYSSLDGTPTPTTLWIVLGPRITVSQQQINTAIGNILAFFTKVFLSIAVATAHDQICWRAIRSHSTKLGVIDTLFTSRNEVFSALSPQIWWKFPVPSLLLLSFWLLPIAPLVTPSSLTIEPDLLPSTRSVRVPQIDFTSMNFASLAGKTLMPQVVHQSELMQVHETSLTYEGPQDAVKRAVQSSLMSSSIPKIETRWANATWDLEFFGPYLECISLDGSEHAETRTSILTNYAQNFEQGTFIWMPYLSWVPGDGVNGSLPFTDHTFRLGTISGSPLLLYMMIPPFSELVVSSPNVSLSQIVDYLQNDTQLWQITLQNVSYSASFTYINGNQDIKMGVSAPLNNVPFLSGFENHASSKDLSVDLVNQTTIFLNQTAVQTFAYQAVMDAFASMLVGKITYDPQGDTTNYQHDTSISMTSLSQAKEMTHVSNASATSLTNVHWNGKSFDQRPMPTRTVVDLIPEMFRNATMSLMAEAALNPDYDSIYAPGNVSVHTLLSQNRYRYSANLLWIIYGVAIGLAASSVLVGFVTMIVSKASYSTNFSTILRVSQNITLPHPVGPQEMSGKDPLPKNLRDAVIDFHPKSQDTEMRGILRDSIEE